MFKIKEAIIVEGTYDKIKLNQIIDATVIITGGFTIFKDKKKMEMIKTIAKKTGIVVLTDSDRAGFMIRNYIKQCVPAEYIKHAYIPEIEGVEKRKKVPGKEGLLGVEGVKNSYIIEAFRKAGCIIENTNKTKEIGRKITKTDLYEDGLSGHSNSQELRKKLKTELNLPTKISTNALLDVLNTLYSYKEYKVMINKVNMNGN